MSENEQGPEPTSSTKGNEQNDQAVPKIDFGVDEKAKADSDSGESKDVGPKKDSGSETKPKQDQNGAPTKDAEASQNTDPKKNAEPGNEIESNEKTQADMEERFEKQLAVNRKLASMLEEQLDILLSVRQSTLAIQKVLESSATSKKKLEAALEAVKNGADGLPDIHWINRVRGTLAMLQRSGVV
jgi:hypothetical protein